MHGWRRLVAAAFISLATAFSAATPVVADATGDAWTDGKHIGAGAESSASGPTGTAGTASRRPVCEWERLSEEHAAIADDFAESGTGPARGEGDGAWYRKICRDPGGRSTATIVWAPDRVDPAVLAQRAADQVPIPSTSLQMNPSPGDGAVVNVETWLWVDRSGWRAVSAQAAAGAVVVTVTANPRRVVWDMGNGDRVTCEGPGTPYDASRPSSEQSTDCSYTYRKSSARAEGGAYTVTATVVWEVSWTVIGAAGGGSLGTSPRSQSIRLPVKEIQAVNR